MYRLFGNEINLTVGKCSYADLVSEIFEVKIDGVFYYLLYVACAVLPGKHIAQAQVLEIVFIIGLQQTLSMYVVSRHLVDDVKRLRRL